jgi:zinc transporter
MNQPFILRAYEIHKNGTGTPLSGDDVTEKLREKELGWVHLDATDPAVRRWLHNEVSYLDDIILDALLAEETRPRILEFDSGVLLILRGMNLNENAEPEDMVSMRLWIDPNRIISLQRRNLRAIQDIADDLEGGQGPTNAADFLVQIVARLFERMEPVLDELDEQTDHVEERVMHDPQTDERQEIIDIRQQAIIFRRYIAPQRDVIMQLRTSDLPWIDQMHKRRLQESLDRVTRYVEDLDAIRERAQIIKDELANALADRMNRNLYVLSVIAAVFLPLGFLTGLMGINIGGMPGVDNPLAFWIFCGFLAVVTGLQVWIFKLLKWF